MIRMQIQIEEDQWKWLKSKAAQRGVSISQHVREGIVLFRSLEERHPEDEKARALRAVGRFASWVSDISERHDDYLSGSLEREIHEDR
jgi:hypothetical protein